ncbi:MAG: hypothetical protein ABIJ03_02825 [Patescibacteria group bacterium]|nr:hypothetical protein [Patescibacteria group bacterium]
MDKRSVFLKIYANLPVGSRNEIVVVVDEQPMTWNSVWLEVNEETPLSKKILEKLVDLEILNDE